MKFRIFSRVAARLLLATTLLFGALASPQARAITDPVANKIPLLIQYQMDQAPVSAANGISDSTGNTHGTLKLKSGATGLILPALVPGANPALSAKAWNFSAANSYLEVSDINPALAALGDITKTPGISVAFWYKYDGNPSAVIVSLPGTLKVHCNYQNHNDATFLAFDFGSGANIPQFAICMPTPLIQDGWHHYVASVDFTRNAYNVQAYVDGQQTNFGSGEFAGGTMTTTPALSNPIANPFNSAGPLTIQFPSGAISGEIDQLGLYGKALGPEEVSQLFNTGTIAIYTPVATAVSSSTQPIINNAFTLTGTANNFGQGAVTARWTQVSGPGAATLGSSTQLITTATLPVPGDYVFQLDASNGSRTATSQVAVTAFAALPVRSIASVNGAPAATILSAPGSSVTLSGASEVNGVPNPASATYLWTVTSGPSGATIANPTSANTSATFAQAGSYVLTLTATSNGTSNSTSVTVVVAGDLPPALVASTAPVVTSTPNTVVSPILLWPKNSVDLYASATPAIAGKPITYSWKSAAGPGTVTFTSASSATPTATFSAPGIYKLTATASDGTLSSSQNVWINIWDKSPGLNPPAVMRRLSPAPAPYIHPRLLFTSSDLPDLQARAQNDAVTIAANTKQQAMVDSSIGSPTTPGWPTTPGGIAYQEMLSGNLEANIDAELTNGYNAYDANNNLFLNCARAAYLAWVRQDNIKLKELSTVVANSARVATARYGTAGIGADENLPICYDILYNYMSEDQRADTRATLALMSHGTKLYRATSDQDFILQANGNLNANDRHYLTEGSAIYGETGYDANSDFLNYQTVGIFDSEWGITPDGFNHEGVGYFCFGMDTVAEAELAWARNGEFENYFVTTHLYNILQGIALEMSPLATATARISGNPTPVFSYGQSSDFAQTRILRMLQYLFPADPLADFVTQNCPSGGSLSDAIFAVSPLASYNGQPPSFASMAAATKLPPTMFDPQMGLGIARSDWAPAATVLQFMSTPSSYYSAHDHSDRNSFDLHGAGRPWFEEGGYYFTPNDEAQTVTIDGIGQANSEDSPLSGGYPWLEGQVLEAGDDPVSSQFAGDAKLSYNYTWGSANADSRATSYNSNTPYGIAINTTWRSLFYPGFQLPEPARGTLGWSDANIRVDALAGAPFLFNPVRKAFRTALLVKGPKPYVIIVDDIDKDGAPHDYQWLGNTNPAYNDYYALYRDMMIESGATGSQGFLYHGQDAPAGSPVTGTTPELMVRVLNGPVAPTPMTLVNKTGINYHSQRLVIDRPNVIAPDFKVLLFPHIKGATLPATQWIQGSGVSYGTTAKSVLQVSMNDGSGQVDQITFTPSPDGRTRVSVARTSAGALPSAPANVSVAQGVAPVVSWSPVAGATSYNVKLSATSGGPYTTALRGSNLSGTSFTATGLVTGTTYYFVVSASNGAGQSADSNQAAAVPAPATGLPTPPSNLAISTGSGTPVLSWSPSAGATSYSVKTASSPSGSYFDWIANVTAVSAPLVNLSPGSFYYFFVTALNGSGESAVSAPISFATAVSIPAQNGGPLPPESLTAVATALAVKLNWPPVAGATAYRVYKKSGSSYSLSGSTASTSFIADNLSAGTGYSFAVSTVNQIGESGFSGSVTATPLAAAALPAAPGSPVAVASSATSISIEWAAVPQAETYTVYRSTNPGGPFTSAVASKISLTNFLNTGVTTGTVYYYQITAINKLGEGPHSATVSASATTNSPSTAPAVPGYLAASPGVNQAILTWRSTLNATSYNLYRGTAAGGPYGMQVNGSTPITSATYTDNGLAAGTRYFYVVSAVNKAGESGKSGEVSVILGAAPVALPAPTGLAALSGPKTLQVTLQWDSADGASFYNLYRSAGGGAAVLANSAPLTKTLFTDTLAPGTTYAYSVTDISPQGLESQKSFAVVYTTTPASPTNLSATPSSSTVRVAWSAPSGATSYSIGRATSPAGPFALIAQGITGTSFSDQSLTSGAYSYAVAANNNGGTSPLSNPATASVTLLPAAPDGLTASASGEGLVTLRWNASTSGATSFTVLRSVTPGSGYSAIATGISAVTWTDHGLVAGQTYSYELQALNAYGASAPSPAVSITAQTLYGAWKIANGLATTTSDTAVLDGDNLPLLIKFATAAPAGTPAPNPLKTGTTNNSPFVQFTRLSPAPAAYTVEASSDLMSWTSIASLASGSESWSVAAGIAVSQTPPVSTAIAPGIVALTESVTITEPAGSPAPAKRFFRLRVSR